MKCPTERLEGVPLREATGLPEPAQYSLVSAGRSVKLF